MKPETLLAELEHVLPIPVDCVQRACAYYDSFNIPDELRPILDGAPRGIAIWNVIWYLLRQHFDAEGEVRIICTKGLPVLFVQSNGAAIRINKVEDGTFEGPVSKKPRTLSRFEQYLFGFSEDDRRGHLVLGHTTRIEGGAAVLNRIVLTLEDEGGVIWSRYIDDERTLGSDTDLTPGLEPTPPAVYPKTGERKTSDTTDTVRGPGN